MTSTPTPQQRRLPHGTLVSLVAHELPDGQQRVRFTSPFVWMEATDTEIVFGARPSDDNKYATALASPAWPATLLREVLTYVPALADIPADLIAYHAGLTPESKAAADETLATYGRDLPSWITTSFASDPEGCLDPTLPGEAPAAGAA